MSDNYTPLFSEILIKVSKLKTKSEKVNCLRQYNSDALRMIIKSSFDPKIEWNLPDGEVPFIPNDAPEGTEHTMLAVEARKLFHFIRGADNKITQNKRESMFVQMLEGLHESEAHLLVAAKNKALHQKYKGLSGAVVKEAFNWTDEFVMNDQHVYHQQPGSASGV